MDSANRPPTGTSRPPTRSRHENSHALPKGTLPKKLQLFFAPRVPLAHMPPMRKKKPALPYTGIAQYLCYFEEKKEEEEKEPEPEPEQEQEKQETQVERKFRNPEYTAQARIDTESKMEKILRLRKQRIDHNAEKVKKAMEQWDPSNDPKIQVGDPFKTLFVGRMSYQTSERDLKKIFGEYGPIRTVRIVKDIKTNKSKGYGFVEYEHISDMKDAYKHADGTKVEGRRVLVDVERGRAMEGWRPARLNGGLGAPTRKPKSKRSQQQPPEKTPKESERESRPRVKEEPERSSSKYRESRRDAGRPRSNRERPRERDYDYERRGRSERGREEKRHRENIPYHEDRPGKKIRELEEGEVDHREVKETRRRERDMVMPMKQKVKKTIV